MANKLQDLEARSFPRLLPRSGDTGSGSEDTAQMLRLADEWEDKEEGLRAKDEPFAADLVGQCARELRGRLKSQNPAAEDETTNPGACSECDTPETDAEIHRQYASGNTILSLSGWAKRMERERNEARREAHLWQERWMNDTPLHEVGTTVMPWMVGWKDTPNVELSCEDTRTPKRKENP